MVLVSVGSLSTGEGTAVADQPVDRAAQELRSNDDFRVRTQAALALGASRDKRAVKPLCGGLDDGNTTVRAAAAAALGKLNLGGQECLKRRAASEPNASVKSVIARALEKIGGSQKPTVTDSTKYYVAVGPTTDKTGRSGTGVDDLVRGALEEAAGTVDGAVVAPKDEKPGEAKTLLAKHKQVKSFYLWPKVMAPDYSGGKLTLRFEIAVFTYPNRSLKGTIPMKLTMPDVDSADKEAEDDLIKQAATSGFAKFKQNLSRLE